MDAKWLKTHTTMYSLVGTGFAMTQNTLNTSSASTH